MERGKLSKQLQRLGILGVLICVAATAISLNVDSRSQIKEHQTDKAISQINRKLTEFTVADENDRCHKINAFMALADFQTQLNEHELQRDRVDSEFSGALSHITDWFYNSYVDKINKIEKEADGCIDEIEQHISGFSAEVDRISEKFGSDNEEPPEEPTDEPADEPTDEANERTNEERTLKAGLFSELYETQALFAEDEFIKSKIEALDELIVDLTEVKTLISEENVIDSNKAAALNEKIDSLIELYSGADVEATVEAENVMYRLNSELSSQTVWFEEHYTLLIDEISSVEKEDEYDKDTVSTQIEELELVKQFIEDDGVVSDDFTQSKNEVIDQLIEEYEAELVLIDERITERDAAAAASSRKTTNTTSNSTANNNSSNNNNSSSNTSSSSGSSGTVSASRNNNYPSISANDREILARTVRLEAPNEGADGKQAVAEVILNRMVSSRWSHANTVEEVVFDTKWGTQFAVKDLVWTDRGTPRAADYAAADRALSGPNILSKDYMFFAMSAGNHTDVLWIGIHAFRK